MDGKLRGAQGGLLSRMGRKPCGSGPLPSSTDSLAARAASGLENRDDTERLGVRLLGYPPNFTAAPRPCDTRWLRPAGFPLPPPRLQQPLAGLRLHLRIASSLSGRRHIFRVRAEARYSKFNQG